MIPKTKVDTFKMEPEKTRFSRVNGKMKMILVGKTNIT